MFGKGKTKGTVQFSVKPDKGAKAVAVTGSFTNWKPVAMKRNANGRFYATVPVPSGTHEYKFIADGQWIADPDHKQVKANPFGTFNSLAIIA